MHLRIEHSTHYTYNQPVTLQDHRLLLTPRASQEVTPISSTIRCTPEASLSWTQDVFGNLIATASFSNPTTELTIVGTALVDQRAGQWPTFVIDPSAHTYPFAYSLDDVIDLGQLREPDWLDPGANEIGPWARNFVAGLNTDTLSLLKDLSAGVLADVAYRVRDEEGTQSPAETLHLKSGSCRDVAALFIEAVRHLGFGARAVSGYLFAPETNLGDEGATHAWAEVYLPSAGWITFDPTHNRVGGANLVPVAVARSNRQIMPVSGRFLGASTDFSSIAVSVRVVEATEV
ncbi:transglutaminase family protein [Sphingobium yanoikuyae]|uniref:transglutaminase family protein n=1 Tax=Sphingobium yanoikuyae TaxID=13690 RepID=UPI0013788926|nr:transglutaminase family protein [Sphingobium yanoikuyae]NBB39045.1 transglutaminase family protein [Sphingobium yanoikuyae]